MFGLSGGQGGGFGAYGYIVRSDGMVSQPFENISGTLEPATSAFYIATTKAHDPASHKTYLQTVDFAQGVSLVAIDSRTGLPTTVDGTHASVALPSHFGAMAFEPTTGELVGPRGATPIGFDAQGFKIKCTSFGCYNPETGTDTEHFNQTINYIATTFAYDSYHHLMYMQEVTGSSITLFSINTITGEVHGRYPLGQTPFRTMHYDSNTNSLIGLMGYDTAANIVAQGMVVGGTGFYRFDIQNQTLSAPLATCSSADLFVANTGVFDPTTNELYLQKVKADGNVSLVALNTSLGGTPQTVVETMDHPMSLSVMTNPPPSLWTLSKMCQATYTHGLSGVPPQPIDGYQYFLVDGAGNGGQGFYAIAYKNENQVVVAFRGTELENEFVKVKNLLADVVFTSENPSASELTTFANYINQGATVLKNVRDEIGDTNITLTGHSLGGGLTQVLGNTSGLPAVAFNAPGAGHLLNRIPIIQAVNPITNVAFSHKGTNQNLRMYGDQASFAGTPSDRVETKTIELPNHLAKYAGNYSFIITNHGIDLMKDQIEEGAVQYPSFVGPAKGYGSLVWTGETFLNGTSKIYKFFADMDEVVPYLYGFDPEPSKEYVFTSTPSSPAFASIALPKMGNVTAYRISTNTNGAWDQPIIIPSLDTHVFAVPTRGIKFSPLNKNGAIIPMPDYFLFDVGFNRTGTFEGELAFKPFKKLSLAPIYNLLLN